MKVTIKEFAVDMEVKSKGIEFEVRSPDGEKHVGDLVLSKSNIVWCPGRVKPENGIKVSWDGFIKLMEDHDGSKKSPK